MNPNVTPVAEGTTNALSLGEVLRVAVPIHARQYEMPLHHWKVLRALMACRTATFGGHSYRCLDCGHEHFVPHSCGNRHCPSCQPMLGADWMQKQVALLLPIPYFHIVFTLPHRLHPLIAQNQDMLYNLLFDCAAATLLEFGKHRFQAQLGISMVLHTWGQNLHEHYHVHSIVTGGGLALDGQSFRRAKDYWLFPVKALSKVYRGKYRAGLLRLKEEGKLRFHGQLAEDCAGNGFLRLIKESCRKPWVVYAKRPFAGPEQVLAYLARYTHRVGLSDRRLLALDTETGAVTFSWKDYAHGGARKVMILDAVEFVRRFRSHILPPRFVKIRHYGLHSNRSRAEKIAQARSLLPEEPSNLAREPLVNRAEKPPHTCPHCSSERLALIDITHHPKRRNPKPSLSIQEIKDTS